MPEFVNISLPASEQAKFSRWVKTLTIQNRTDCNKLIRATALKIQRRAKQLAPVGKRVGAGAGFLRASIGYQITNQGFGAEITAGGQGGGAFVKYAPYVEFGTGGRVQVPVDLVDYAIQFKGAGLRRINNRAQPYFFPAVRLSTAEMHSRLKEMGFR